MCRPAISKNSPVFFFDVSSDDLREAFDTSWTYRSKVTGRPYLPHSTYCSAYTCPAKRQ